MKRRFIAVLLTAALVAGSSLTVCAAEEEISILENYEEPVEEAEVEIAEAEIAETEMAETEAEANPEPEADETENVAEEVVNIEETAKQAAFFGTDENGIKYELADGVLTVSGNGAIGRVNDVADERNNKLSPDDIKSVIIEDGITEIGANAFAGCENLSAVSIPDSVTEIGQFAFGGCKNLSTVTIPGSVKETGVMAFTSCGLKSVIISEGVQEISTSSFSACKNLTAISIPNSVAKIDLWAFTGCGFTTISIPDGVTEIGQEAFAGCPLTEIVIPGSVTKMASAFKGCENLTKVTLPDGISKIEVRTFEGCRELKEIAIPDSVTEIAYGAFENCESLPEITIPASVKSIGGSAFAECVGLQSITFKGNAPEISEDFPGKGLLYGDVGEPFHNVKATAYYPVGNRTYTDELKASYGTELKWEEQMPELSFTDVNTEDWYYEAAGFVFSRGIMKGMNDAEFGPSVKLSRAQFATILYRIEGEPPVEYDSGAFPDVADNQFYTQAAMWAKNSEVITGYDNGDFGPADEITREQMAVMMYRYAGKLKLDTSARDELGGFPDAEKVSPFADEAVKWAVGEGLIKGDGGNINPQGKAERAQCATIIMRFLNGYTM